MTTVKGTVIEATAQDESSLSTTTLPTREKLSPPPLLEQITSLISQFNSVNACRIVEVLAKKQRNLLLAQGHKPELPVSLSIKVDRKKRLIFYENWPGGGRRVGETLPADYDISNKMVSRKAQARIDELASLLL